MHSVEEMKKQQPQKNIYLSHLIPILSHLIPVLDYLGLFPLAYAVFEYWRWMTHSTGIVSGWLNSSFTFFAHPFVILIFLILGTIIPNALHKYVQKIIAASGVMVREFIYKLFEIAKLICCGLLTLIAIAIYEYISNSTAVGACEHFFSCAAVLTPETSQLLFLPLYIVIILLCFAFCNLPPTQTIQSDPTGITVLNPEDTGLYGLQPGQFAFIHTIGEYDRFQLVPDNYRPIKGYRIYKSERQRWFVIYENSFCLTNDNLKLNLGFWQLQCSYEAKIGDRNAIDCSKISLPILESPEQLQATIEAECIIKFREKIASEFLYQRANQELTNLYAKSKTNNQSLQALSSIIGQLIRTLINVKELGSNLVNQSRYTIYLYGKLFEVSFQVKDIEIIEREEERIDDFLNVLQQESEGLNKKLKLAIELLQKGELFMDREDYIRYINSIIETIGISNFATENTQHKKETKSDFQNDSNYYYDI